jgi:hypothetical protein
MHASGVSRAAGSWTSWRQGRASRRDAGAGGAADTMQRMLASWSRWVEVLQAEAWTGWARAQVERL